MKKFILMLCLILGISTVCFAASKNVTVLINRQVKVSYNGQTQEFQNVNGVRVYPITYEGTTYLPIRAISSLFFTEIQWDGETNSIYIGQGDLDVTSAKNVTEFVAGTNEEVEVLLNGDITIYYYDEAQTFTDVNGKIVYPLSYEGTTYLPVRAVSNLFGLTIDWDGENNEVLISETDTDRTNEFIDDEDEENIYYESEDEEEDESIYDIRSNEDAINEQLQDDTDAIEVNNSIYSYFDENNREINYYFSDDGKVVFYYINEFGQNISYYYNENGEITYINE